MATTNVEGSLRELLAQRGIALDAGTMAQTFAGLGLDSLHVVEIQLELEQLLGVELGEGDQIEGDFHGMTLADFAAHVEGRLAPGGQR